MCKCCKMPENVDDVDISPDKCVISNECTSDSDTSGTLMDFFISNNKKVNV